MSAGSLEHAITYFYSKLYELRDQYIPKKLIKSNSYLPWFKSSLVKALKEKSQVSALINTSVLNIQLLKTLNHFGHL